MAGNWFHFTVKLYSDEAMSNLVATISSEEEWWNFTGNGMPFTSQGIYIEDGLCIDVKYNIPNDKSEEFYNRILYARVEDPILNITSSSGSSIILFVALLTGNFRMSSN